MHILIIPSTYPSPENQTRGIFYRDQALALRKAGHSVAVLVAPIVKSKRKILSGDLSFYKNGIKTYNDHGVRTIVLKYWSWIPFSLSPAFHFFYIKKMQEEMLDMFLSYSEQYGMPDIIHAHTAIWGGVLGCFLKKKTKLPFILTEHSTGFSRKIYKPWQLTYAQKTFQSADVLLAVSESLSDAIKQLDKKLHILVLGNIVSTDYFQPAEQLSSNNPFTITSIGFLDAKKNFSLLIRAFAKAFKRDNRSMLNIVGDGAEKKMLEKLSKELGLEKKVKFWGHLERPKVLQIIKNSHTIVSSSNIETFGVTLIEAHSCGKPVIATRSGGPEDFVTKENGILVPVGDVSAMKNAMLKMHATWFEYNPAIIRENCVRQFGEKSIVTQLEKVYNEQLEKLS